MLTCWVTAISPRGGEEQASWASAFGKKQYCFSSESIILTWGEEVFVGGISPAMGKVGLVASSCSGSVPGEGAHSPGISCDLEPTATLLK